MHAFTQGTIDTFCSAYAVLNALQITHGIKPGEARLLFSRLIMLLSHDREILDKVLSLKTNYIALTETFLSMCNEFYPIKVTNPFANMVLDEQVQHEEIKEIFWNALYTLDPENNRTCVFQFEKRLPLASYPIFAHWTTGYRAENNEFHLFDCSPEHHAVHTLYKDASLFRHNQFHEGEYFYINAKSLRLIEKA